MEPIKILVIDDEPVICDGCRLTLSDQGFAVDSCNSGTNGLEMLRGGEYDLALLDMTMPGMTAMWLASRTVPARREAGASPAPMAVIRSPSTNR